MNYEVLIQRELDRMDGGLFLDKEADAYGRVVYKVKHFVEGTVSPYTALEWVYPDGNPKPLSEDLISSLRAQEGSIQEAVTQAIVNNAAKKELERQAAYKQSEEIAHEYDFEKRGKRSSSIGPGRVEHL